MNSSSSSPNDSCDWYLATSKPRQESRAVENLLNQGIKAYSPVLNVEKIRAGKKQIVEEAMFTGYVFINISPEDGLWHKVKSTRGIRDWVRFSGKAAKLPDRLVESLKNSENETKSLVIKKQFEKGESVRILSGPFEGLKGVFLADSGEKRSMILIEFLGNQNRLNVSNDELITD